jgi:methionine synthase I (cobalamin-dependent)/5,10-methylenetetrahydrofolate reductase
LDKASFIKKLQKSVLVCDGAMGTVLYSQGIFINRCFDELNLSDPDMVRKVHQAYVAARADILETNTFGANIFKLKPHGLEAKVHLINRRGAELARMAAEENPSVLVAGSIGPLGVRLQPLGTLKPLEASAAFRQQAEGLLQGGVDLFILETFSDLNEIILALQVIKEISDLPVVAQMTFNEEGKALLGATPEAVVEALGKAGADVVGANCSVGPQPMLDVIESMAKAGAGLIAAQPNAGNPRIIEGRVLYMSTPEYHAEFARRFIAAGANIVGGCCGTTPEHIKAIANAVRALHPHKQAASVVTGPKKEISVEVTPRETKSALAARLGKKFVISVEVLSPRGIDPSAVLAGVRKLVGFGVDAINIPDGPRASARMSPMALAQLIERTLPVETILHYCCRDRNLLGMQSDLLGAYALGLRNILLVTGDPPKFGNYPDATAVFDVDSIGLTRIVQGLNHGYDIAGNPIGEPTSWHIGVGANPAAIDFELEINRLYQKAEAGAEFILTQPVFEAEQLQCFLDRIRDINLPILAGVMPLTNYRMVEFLNNEVPGVTVPEHVGQRIARASSSEEASKIGIHIAQEAILQAKQNDKVAGLYLMPPFTKDKYDSAIEVLQVLR